MKKKTNWNPGVGKFYKKAANKAERSLEKAEVMFELGIASIKSLQKKISILSNLKSECKRKGH